MIRPGELIIDDSVDPDLVFPKTHSRGGIPRDWNLHPRGSYAGIQAVDVPLIPQSEWSARIQEKVAKKTQLSDIRRVMGPNGGLIPSLDQDGVGYCWAHSSTGGVMIARAMMGLPYVPLSAFMVGCLVKGYRDEGGWGAQSADFIAKNGVPDAKYWPMRSMSRSNDTPDMRSNAALHKIQAQWADLAQPEYDRTLTFAQVASLLLQNCPVVVDFNWWSHSVLGMDLVEISAGSFGIRILNSWGDSWSQQGEGVLQGSKAIPDGAIGIMTVEAAAA